MARRPALASTGQNGLGRAALILAGAVIAAALVLAGGALRSGLSPSPRPSAAPSGPDSLGSASLPPIPTSEPSLASPPATPEPTEPPGLRGEFVGPLGHVESCPILYEREGVLELVLPDGYRSRIRGDAVQILGPGGAVVASEGDLIGVNGRVGGGGSFCLVGSRLHVSKIVEVRPRDEH